MIIIIGHLPTSAFHPAGRVHCVPEANSSNPLIGFGHRCMVLKLVCWAMEQTLPATRDSDFNCQ